MGRRILTLLVLSIFLAAGSSTVQGTPSPAQRGQRQGRQGGPAGSGGQFVGSSFERVAPAIGEPMPDLVVYDPDGKALQLRQLLGEHYTVLILGCLT
ncbi:MAG: hypothetical protein ACE5HV_10755 [Acidobacteriota bacterium]